MATHRYSTRRKAPLSADDDIETDVDQQTSPGMPSSSQLIPATQYSMFGVGGQDDTIIDTGDDDDVRESNSSGHRDAFEDPSDVEDAEDHESTELGESDAHRVAWRDIEDEIEDEDMDDGPVVIQDDEDEDIYNISPTPPPYYTKRSSDNTKQRSERFKQLESGLIKLFDSVQNRFERSSAIIAGEEIFKRTTRERLAEEKAAISAQAAEVTFYCNQHKELMEKMEAGLGHLKIMRDLQKAQRDRAEEFSKKVSKALPPTKLVSDLLQLVYLVFGDLEVVRNLSPEMKLFLRNGGPSTDKQAASGSENTIAGTSQDSLVPPTQLLSSNQDPGSRARERANLEIFFRSKYQEAVKATKLAEAQLESSVQRGRSLDASLEQQRELAGKFRDEVVSLKQSVIERDASLLRLESDFRNNLETIGSLKQKVQQLQDEEMKRCKESSIAQRQLEENGQEIIRLREQHGEAKKAGCKHNCRADVQEWKLEQERLANEVTDLKKRLEEAESTGREREKSRGRLEERLTSINRAVEGWFASVAGELPTGLWPQFLQSYTHPSPAPQLSTGVDGFGAGLWKVEAPWLRVAHPRQLDESSSSIHEKVACLHWLLGQTSWDSWQVMRAFELLRMIFLDTSQSVGTQRARGVANLLVEFGKRFQELLASREPLAALAMFALRELAELYPDSEIEGPAPPDAQNPAGLPGLGCLEIIARLEETARKSCYRRDHEGLVQELAAAFGGHFLLLRDEPELSGLLSPEGTAVCKESWWLLIRFRSRTLRFIDRGLAEAAGCDFPRDPPLVVRSPAPTRWDDIVLRAHDFAAEL